jgi:HSP20 family molecular chaperone IbpA
MWGEACQLLEQAERLHQQFFRLGERGRARLTWEPPVDIFEDDDEILIVVALPGVPDERIEVSIEAGALVVRAGRQMPLAGNRCTVHRLEIPHGCFERRLQLPPVRLRLHARQLVNGCLVLNLLKVR